MLLIILSISPLWYWCTFILIIVGLIYLFYFNTGRQETIPESDFTDQIKFEKWCKEHFKKVEFPDEYENKDQLHLHVYCIITEKLRYKYVLQTTNAIYLNDVKKLCDNLVDFLINENKITFKEKDTV